jgi:hypothetical protein
VKKNRGKVTFTSLDDHLDAVKENTAPPDEGSVNRSVVSVDSAFTLNTVTASEIRAFPHDDDLGVDNFFSSQPAAPPLPQAHPERHAHSVRVS